MYIILAKILYTARECEIGEDQEEILKKKSIMYHIGIKNWKRFADWEGVFPILVSDSLI